MKRKAVASKLAAWQQEDAGRLKKLIEAAKDGPERLTVEALADRAGVGTPSFLSQIANAYRPVSFEHALKLATALGVAVEEISPTHAAALAAAPRAYAGDPPPPPPRDNGISALDRAMLASYHSLDPSVREAFRTTIGTVAAAISERHAQFMREIERRNDERDTKTRHKLRGKSHSRES